MSTSTQWQLETDAAERYAQILVPTILGPFARALVEAHNGRIWAESEVGHGSVFYFVIPLA